MLNILCRRAPSSTCGKLARDPMLTPSGRRRRSTRRRMRRRMTRRRRKPSSTFNDQLVRRSLTSTSPLLTRVDVAEVTVDVVVAAVVKDADVGVVAAVMVKDAHPTGNYQYYPTLQHFGLQLSVHSNSKLKTVGARFIMLFDPCFPGSAVKVRRVSDAHQGSPGSQDLRERKASNSQGKDRMLTVCCIQI